MTPKIASLYIAFAFVLLAAVVCAQEAADLGTVTVEGEASQEVEPPSPSSFKSVVKMSDEDIGFENLSDILSTNVSVTSRSLGGLGQYSTINIRGATSNQIGVFIDGVRLNPPSSGSFDFSTIPLDSVETVEILRGGGTAQFGSDAVGGVINITTKKAGAKRTIEAYAGGGSFTTVKGGASYRERFKKNKILLTYEHLQSEGDFSFKANTTGRTYNRLNNGFYSDNPIITWDHDFSDKVTLKFMNNFFRTARQIAGPEEETILRPFPPQANQRLTRNTTSLLVSVKPVEKRALELKAGVSNNFIEDKYWDPIPMIGAATDVTTYDVSFNPFVTAEESFDAKNISQTIFFRYDLKYDYMTNTSPIAGTPLARGKDRIVNSAAIQDEVELFNKILTLLPVARWEYATKYSNNSSGKFGAAVAPLKWLKFKSNIERSYRLPTLDELYYPNEGYIRGNPNLKKEEAWNFDGGAEISCKYGRFEAVYFKNWIENSILFVPISALVTAPVNTFGASVEGAEISLEVSPIKYLELAGNYTYTDAHYNGSGNQLPGRTPHMANGRATIKYDVNDDLKFSVSGDVNYQSRTPTNQENTIFIKGRAVLNAGANIKFKKHYYINFEAKDINNVQAYDSLGYPLPRRSFFVTLGAKWS